MLRRISHVLVLLLLVNLSVNAQNESSTVSAPVIVEATTEKVIETTLPITISTVPSDLATTTATNVTDVHDSSTIIVETATNATIANTTQSQGNQTIENTTTNIPESSTAATISNTTESQGNQTIDNITTNIPELSTAAIGTATNVTISNTTVSQGNQTIENITTQSSKIETGNSTSSNLPDSSVDNKTNTNGSETHPDKPSWAHTEPSKPKSIPIELNSTADGFTQNIIFKLAEYILSHSDSSSNSSLSSVDLIANELVSKLDQSNLDMTATDVEAVRTTTKVFFKNLPVIIRTIIKNLNKAGNENCPIQFKFLGNIYCIEFDLQLSHATPLTTTTTAPLPITNTTESRTDLHIESFQVSNTNHVDVPPPSWQQWFSPTTVEDQPSSSTSHTPVLVCYYTNWAQYRNGPGRFYPENIDPTLCTHIVYGFGQLTNGVIAPYEWNDESTQWSTGMYARMMALRKSGKPKILLAVGGWNHGSGKFSDMARDDKKRATFITTTIIFLQKHKFDGLDIDWEYPGSRPGSRPTDKEDYVKLLVELKRAFSPYSLLLTAAVGAGKPTIDAAYNIPKVCEALDLVNLMSYDLHGSWESQTGINSPLYSRASDSETNKQLTQDWAVRYWIDKGCSKSKIVMGLALYGRTFRLSSTTNNGIGAPAVGPGAAGLYTGEAGFLAYYEICNRIQQQGWTKVFDDEQKSNYAYKGQEWVGFDDAYSLSLKVKYAQDMGLAGIMFWAPDLDDFTGTVCNEGKYPLMNTAINVLHGQTGVTTSPTPTTTSASTTTSNTPTSGQGKRIVCYYTNWAQYRTDGGKFFPENLDPSLCTNVIYAFAVLKDSKLAPYEWNDQDTDWSKGMYTRIMELKKSSDIKISLAVGGWNFGSGNFSNMVADTNLRKGFVKQATQFIRDNKFDGLDMDWEYPGSRDGSRPQDKKLFTTLLKELKAAFEPYNLLLSAAVGAGEPTIEAGYEIDKIAKYLDFINLMTYDLHGGGWENSTGFHTALYARPEETDNAMALNQNWAVNYWIQQGMPKEKICMGLAMYGRTFKLVDSSQTGIGAPSSGPGDAGKYTREKGFLAYYEICEKLKSSAWTSKYDDVQKSMYAYGDGMWVGYDNIDTLTIRANYIIGKDLGGVLIWAPDLDDFSGKFCDRGQYPLLNTVVNLIRSNTIVPIVMPTVPTPTVPTPTVTVTTSTNPIDATPSQPTASPSSTASSPSVVCMTTVNPFVFDSLDATLCSHLILVQADSTSTDSTDIFQSALSSAILEQLNVMRTKNPQLKIFYSILGQWKSKHLDLIRDDKQRAKFNKNIQKYLIVNGLDGFDIDWNIPVGQTSALTDKNYLSTWLTELHQAFSPNQLSLSIGVSGDKAILDSSYDFDQISDTVNFIRLMAFDWPSKDVTTLINPLYSMKSQQDDDKFNNINWIVSYVIALGMFPEQISLGIPTYGRWYGLANGNQNTIGSPVVGSSMTIAYSDLCKLLQSTDYTKVYNQETRSSYAFNAKKKQWISSDTADDVALIARYANLQGLAGVTLSSLGQDDVDGRCGNGPYPLLHAVAGISNQNTIQETTTTTQSIDNKRVRTNQVHNVFCSVNSNADTYYGSTQFTLDQIDTNLCTHIIIDHNNSLFSASVSDQLKSQNIDLKFLLTINSNENITINQWEDLLEKNKADGINICMDSKTITHDFLKQIASIKSILPDKYMITISFNSPANTSDQKLLYKILALYEFVDYLIVLPFDEKSIGNFKELQSWNSLAALIQANPDKHIGDFSMSSTLAFILSSDVPKEKLIMGIPTYGLSFLLENENKYSIGDNILASGLPGRITHIPGILASYEICTAIQSNNYERFLSNESVIVMAHKKDNLIIFDDTQSLQLPRRIVNGTVELKAKFIKQSQLGGVLVHSIDMDDYSGKFCNRGKYPITSVISGLFSKPITPPSIETTTTPSKQKTGLCSGIKTKDLIVDEADCHYYYVCLPNIDAPVAHLQCPSNMHFSKRLKACTQEDLPCSSKPKVNKNKETLEATTSETKPKFICPMPDGIFADVSDCTQYFACSNNIISPMKCPASLKFNSQSKQCDWSSDLCP
ncbi:unnamed protein product [Adineta steineri]|uniref:Chitinase n=1 Tax=Adineta steineri TaxID=433720 RepID=A0A815E8V1_9BILA|nr:unnamed protein product [Adineta steineri]CAF1580486.1 unnamed protein product [Adineta steineri]